MDKNEMSSRKQHEAMTGVMKMILPTLKGKSQMGLKILLKGDELSTKIITLAEKYADPKDADSFSEKEFNDVLEYLGLVELGFQQFIDGKEKGETKDA